MGKRIQHIGAYVMDGKTLGKGNFARVELATHKDTGCQIAIKIIDTKKIVESYVHKNLCREAKILSQLRHPNIIRLYETLKASSLYCLVTEYAAGGELLLFIRSHNNSRLTEKEAWPFGLQLISALSYMHRKGVVHRDLKMENIMLNLNKTQIKIIDFGLSNTCGKGEMLKTHCGSPEYAAPELFEHGREYGSEVDLWSLGIILYAMVIGRLPFTTIYADEQKRQKLLILIQKGLTPKHDKDMMLLSTDCRNLLRQLIEPVPELRCPLNEVLEHPWVTRCGARPFVPHKSSTKDMKVRKEVILELAEMKEKTVEEIVNLVREHHCDEISAMYNMMLDERLYSEGYDSTQCLLGEAPVVSPESKVRRLPFSRIGSPPGACTVIARPSVESRRMDYLLEKVAMRRQRKSSMQQKLGIDQKARPEKSPVGSPDPTPKDKIDRQSSRSPSSSVKRFIRNSKTSIPKLRQTFRRSKSQPADSRRGGYNPEERETEEMIAEGKQLKSSLKKALQPSLTVSTENHGLITSPKNKSPGCISVTFADEYSTEKTEDPTVKGDEVEEDKVVVAEVHSNGDCVTQDSKISQLRQQFESLNMERGKLAQQTVSKSDKSNLSADELKEAIYVAKASGAIPKYSSYQNNRFVSSPGGLSMESQGTLSPMSPLSQHLGPRGVSSYLRSPTFSLKSPLSDPCSPNIRTRNIEYCRNLSDDEKLKQEVLVKMNSCTASTTDTESSRSSIRSRDLKFRILTDFKIESIDSLDEPDSNTASKVSRDSSKFNENQNNTESNITNTECNADNVSSQLTKTADVPNPICATAHQCISDQESLSYQECSTNNKVYPTDESSKILPEGRDDIRTENERKEICETNRQSVTPENEIISKGSRLPINKPSRFSKGIGYIGRRISLSPGRLPMVTPIATVESLTSGESSSTLGEKSGSLGSPHRLVSRSPSPEKACFINTGIRTSVPDRSLRLEPDKEYGSGANLLAEASSVNSNSPRIGSRVHPADKCRDAEKVASTLANSRLPQSTCYSSPGSPTSYSGKSSSMQEVHTDKSMQKRRATWRENISKIIRRNHSSPTKQRESRQSASPTTSSSISCKSRDGQKYYKEMEAKWTEPLDSQDSKLKNQRSMIVNPSPLPRHTPTPVTPMFDLNLSRGMPSEHISHAGTKRHGSRPKSTMCRMCIGEWSSEESINRLGKNQINKGQRSNRNQCSSNIQNPQWKY